MVLLKLGKWQTILDCKMPHLSATPFYDLEYGLPDLVWSLRFLQPVWKFLNDLVTVLWSTAPSFFIHKIFLVASVTLWPSLSAYFINFQIRLDCTFIFVAFKLLMEWSCAQPTIYHYTTNHSGYLLQLELLWSCDIQMQTSMYQNIRKLLIHPHTLFSYSILQKFRNITHPKLFSM